jgi:putative transposase
MVFGKRHMDYLCSQFGEHYHGERPHQGLHNDVPFSGRPKRTIPDIVPLSQIGCKSRLGGLLKHYERRVA